MKKLDFVGLIFLAFINVACVSAAEQNLHIEGNQWAYPDNARFIIKGVNVEAYRDYLGGCGYVTDQLFPGNSFGTPAQLAPMINKFKTVGVNAVRLNYDWRYVSSNTYPNLSKFLDIAEAFAKAGMYVMLSDHSMTASDLTYRAAAYPTFKALVDGFRARGIAGYLIMNPFNEPADTSLKDWTVWIDAGKDILNYLRNTVGYKGIVMLDSIEWASENDPVAFQTMVQYDAVLLGGKANVGFSNHWYPNRNIVGVDNSFNTAKNFALAIGELGQTNRTPDTPSFVADVLNKYVTTGMNNGHNGVFGWIWSSCESNKMTDPYDDYTKMTLYGMVYVNDYWTKIASTVPPAMTPAPAITPSPLSTPPVTLSCSGSTSAIAFRSAGSGNNGGGSTRLALNKPAGVVANDVLIAQITEGGSNTNVKITPPAGWTLIRLDKTSNNEKTAVVQSLYYKIATASEPDAFSWSLSSSNEASGGIAAYSGVNTFSPIEAHSGYYGYASWFTIALPVITTLPNTQLLFFDGVATGTTVTPPNGMTERWDTATSHTTASMADKKFAGYGSTGYLEGRHSTCMEYSCDISNLAAVVALKPVCSSGGSPKTK